MAKKKHAKKETASTKEESEKKEEKPVDQFEKMAAQLPKEAQEKLKEIKKSLDKFKEQLLTKFDKYIMGISLLPPQLTPEQMQALPPELAQAAQVQQAQHVSMPPQ